ncbi:2323_t:CDS:2, partial [Racocetra fulgida]
MSFEVTEIEISNNLSLELNDLDTNMSVKVIELESAVNMSFELANSELTETALTTSVPAQDLLVRERSSSKLGQSPMPQDAENTETACDHRNHLKREAYACRKSTLISLQLEQRRLQRRNAYTQRTETESTEKAEERRSKHRKLNTLASNSAQTEHYDSGSLLPNESAKPKFCQIYLYDTEQQHQRRQRIMPDLDPSTLSGLQAMLHE